MASSSKWIVCTPPCRSIYEPNQLLKINDFEFGKYDSQSKCIQKYNTIDNKWTKSIKLNDSNIDGCVSFVLNESKLYIYTKEKLTVINTKQNTRNIYNCNNCPHYSSTIIINNKLHIVGGVPNKHSIWNEQQSQFDVKHQFELGHILCHRLIYLKSKNILLSIGGLSRGNAIDTIYSFDITLNKWSKLKQKLPIPNCLFGCISTRNDKYIILFGGGKTDKIYVLNTKTMKFRKSGICCPKKGRFQAINMNNKGREQLLCFGFINELWNTNKFNNLMKLPFYLTNIITQYVAIEMVHLIHAATGAHWKINVDDIITTLP
eukprot:1996_1